MVCSSSNHGSESLLFSPSGPQRLAELVTRLLLRRINSATEQLLVRIAPGNFVRTGAECPIQPAQPELLRFQSAVSGTGKNH
jgi:hypothetical protein